MLRALQCRSYDNVSLKDNLYHWEPHPDPRDPCALMCRTLETGFVLKMQPHVLNGTSCGEQGGGVCISGKCKVRIVTGFCYNVYWEHVIFMCVALIVDFYKSLIPENI